MKKFFLILALTAFVLMAVAQASGQTPEGTTAATRTNTSITANRVIGEVTAIDATAKQVTVKADAGTLVQVMLDD